MASTGTGVVSPFRNQTRKLAEALGLACVERLGRDSPLSLLVCDSDLVSEEDTLATMELPDLPAGFVPPAGQSCNEAVAAMAPWLAVRVPLLHSLLAQCTQITAQLFETSTSRAVIDAHRLTFDEVFAVVLYFSEEGATQHETFGAVFNDILAHFPSRERREMLTVAFFLLNALRKLPEYCGTGYCVNVSLAFVDFLAGRQTLKLFSPRFMSTTPNIDLARQLADPGGVVLAIPSAGKGKDVSVFLPKHKQRVLFPFNMPLEIGAAMAPDAVDGGATFIVQLQQHTGAIYPNTFRLRRGRIF